MSQNLFSALQKMRKWGILCLMDVKIMKKWTEKVGVRMAVAQIIMKLDCCASKAEKLASGRYPSVPSTLEQIALAELIGCERHVLFPKRVA
jgi:hypothetical protein